MCSAESQTFQVNAGHTVVSSRGSGMTPVIQETGNGRYFAAVLLDLRPTLGIFSLHAPTGGTGDETSMEEALSEIGVRCLSGLCVAQISSGSLGEILIVSSPSFQGSLVGTRIELVCTTPFLLPGTRELAVLTLTMHTPVKRVGLLAILLPRLITLLCHTGLVLLLLRRPGFLLLLLLNTKGGFTPQVRIPVSWEARDYDKFRELVSSENRGDIVSEMERTHTLAMGEAKTRRDLSDPEMERLAARAMDTEDVMIRDAYRHLFRERARAPKLRKEWQAGL